MYFPENYQILNDIPHCIVYVDVALIASPDSESHLHHVCQVLDILRLHSLSIIPAVNFLNHRLSIFVARDVLLARSILTFFGFPSPCGQEGSTMISLNPQLLQEIH